jgi:hypothetical protein
MNVVVGAVGLIAAAAATNVGRVNILALRLMLLRALGSSHDDEDVLCFACLFFVLAKSNRVCGILNFTVQRSTIPPSSAVAQAAQQLRRRYLLHVTLRVNT